MIDASTIVAVLVALFALVLTVVRFRRNRHLGFSASESLGRAFWHDVMIGRNRR